MGSLIKFGSRCVNECVVQYSNLDVWFVGLKGFSRICSDVGVEPKYSEGRLEVLRCEKSVGVSGGIPAGFSGVLCDGD